MDPVWPSQAWPSFIICGHFSHSAPYPISRQVGAYHLNVKIDSVVAAMTNLFSAICGRVPRFRLAGEEGGWLVGRAGGWMALGAQNREGEAHRETAGLGSGQSLKLSGELHLRCCPAFPLLHNTRTTPLCSPPHAPGSHTAPLMHFFRRVHGGSAAENLALQNIQARLRMVLAFMLAQVGFRRRWRGERWAGILNPAGCCCPSKPAACSTCLHMKGLA